MDTKTERIALRITSADKERLKQAAKLQHKTLTDFVIAASREAADAVLGYQTRFVIPQAQMQTLVTALEAPPCGVPQLKALFARPSIF